MESAYKDISQNSEHLVKHSKAWKREKKKDRSLAQAH